jgi:subtilisin family serine protease
MWILKRCILSMTLAAGAANAQIRLPVLPLPTLPVQTLPQTLGQIQGQTSDQLSALRRLEVARLIRANRRVVDTDQNGDPIVRNEILGLSPADAAMDGARAAGFTIDREQVITPMNLRLAVFKAPQTLSTKQALRILREADPGGSYDYNHIYGGASSLQRTSADDDAPASTATQNASTSGQNASATYRARIGLLDTGVDATHPVFRDSAIHTWGCGDHTVPAAHGTAVASLLIGRGEKFQGVQPGAELYAADVYCGLPTGGAVDALVAAFGWLVREGVPVINVSLVGPKNLMLQRVIGSLIAGGYIIVAAVGNDGPAAPPLYPASYADVVGVTAVDSHRRALIEAARGPQVMFAAPGADMAAADGAHGYAAVRGTSFAAPFVAALLASRMEKPDVGAAAAAIDALAKSAIDLGPPGRDLTYGFGLVGEDRRIDRVPLTHR